MNIITYFKLTIERDKNYQSFTEIENAALKFHDSITSNSMRLNSHFSFKECNKTKVLSELVNLNTEDKVIGYSVTELRGLCNINYKH